MRPVNSIIDQFGPPRASLFQNSRTPDRDPRLGQPDIRRGAAVFSRSSSAVGYSDLYSRSVRLELRSGAHRERRISKSWPSALLSGAVRLRDYYAS